tara:strand:+ start:1919 stop:2602 length:684 start_codon:yes stop_codon:yes gene_type:complete
MSYGLKVFNGDGLTILDSSEGLSTFIKTNSNTIGSATSYPVNFPTGIDVTDLFFVRPTSNIFVSEFVFGGTRKIYRSGTSALDWLEADNTQGNFSSGFDTGYGLNVFDGTGTAASDLLFSSNTAQSLDIVSVGSYSDLGSNTELQININSSTPHYVLLNGSLFGSASITGYLGSGGTIERKRGYEYYYSSGTNLSYIKIISTFAYPGSAGLQPGGGQMAYMIVKLRG